MARRAISRRREPPEDAQAAELSTVPALPPPHRDAETSHLREYMRKIKGKSQMNSRPVAVKRCGFRSELVVLCLQAATAPRARLRCETGERHHQAERNQPSPFVLGGSCGLPAATGPHWPAL